MGKETREHRNTKNKKGRNNKFEEKKGKLRE